VRACELPARSELPGRGRLLAARSGVEVLIDDDGAGIPAELHTKVFLPFFTTKKSGLGLGLAIVQKIVRDHGGDIACEQAPIGGARFRISVPLHDPRDARRSGDTSKSFARPTVPPPAGTSGGAP
jgi:signal transduction histidine kinase